MAGPYNIMALKLMIIIIVVLLETLLFNFAFAGLHAELYIYTRLVSVVNLLTHKLISPQIYISNQ